MNTDVNIHTPPTTTMPTTLSLSLLLFSFCYKRRFTPRWQDSLSVLRSSLFLSVFSLRLSLPQFSRETNALLPTLLYLTFSIMLSLFFSSSYNIIIPPTYRCDFK